MKPFHILVCGGRDFANPDVKPREEALKEYRFLCRKLNELASKHSAFYVPEDNWLPSDIVIISGHAVGADRAAEDWAVVNWAHWIEFPADWKKYGKSAGYIRNKQMLVEGRPDLVVAFPGGRGTANMVKLAKEAGVPVIEYTYPE